MVKYATLCLLQNHINLHQIFEASIYLTLLTCILELLSELARREKDAGIFPEAEVDLFMKVVYKEKHKSSNRHFEFSYVQSLTSLFLFTLQAVAMEGVENSLITDYTLRVSQNFNVAHLNNNLPFMTLWQSGC